jgi:4-amino-4-deoxy-L-arabinose transferase-like glycosyltransferase
MTQRHIWTALLCIAWILPGVLGHDPWKPDEAYTFGVVYDMLRSGSWLVPTLTGEPFLDEPPLYYLTAAASGVLFSGVLPLHDAARLATAFYMALTFIFCGLAGRELHGRGMGTLTVLLLLGAFGLMVRGHQMITDIVALTGFCIAFYALSLTARRPGVAGIWLGVAIGVVFLAQGIFESLMLITLALVLPAVATPWRTRAYAHTLIIAFVVALPLVITWPALLYARSPALIDAWLQRDLFMRTLAGGQAWTYFLRILPWFAWPLWLVALWRLWRARRTDYSTPALALPLAGFAVCFVALTVSGEARELNALPLLPALALLAAPGVAQLRRGAASAWFWFGVMGFVFFAIVGWFYWMGLELGVPARLHKHLHRIQPGYAPGLKILPFAIAAMCTLAWFVMLAKLKRDPERPVIVWAASVTVLWVLVATLFIGWVDAGKSYRAAFADLRRNMPAQHRCMASRDFNESQRAMLHYFENIVTHRLESPAARRDCDLMLVQGVAQEERVPLGGWDKIWEGNRPGDKIERYRLYRRSP